MTDSRPSGLAHLLDRLRLHRLAGPLAIPAAIVCGHLVCVSAHMCVRMCMRVRVCL